MLLNNAISVGVGVVPIVGDIVLAMFKANSRNAALLEEFLRVRGAEFLKAERERAEDPQTVRPGAGRAPGEDVPGTAAASASAPAPPSAPERAGTGRSWFRRGSKGGSKKEKGKAGEGKASVAAPSPDRGRFVEDVPPNEVPDVGKSAK